MSTATRSAARYTPMCGRARRCTGLESSGRRCATPSRRPPADLVKQHTHRSRVPFLGRTTAQQRTCRPRGPFLGRTTAQQRTRCPRGPFLDRTLILRRHSRPQLRFPMLPSARSHSAFRSSGAVRDAHQQTRSTVPAFNSADRTKRAGPEACGNLSRVAPARTSREPSTDLPDREVAVVRLTFEDGRATARDLPSSELRSLIASVTSRSRNFLCSPVGRFRSRTPSRDHGPLSPPATADRDHAPRGVAPVAIATPSAGLIRSTAPAAASRSTTELTHGWNVP
ncbi:MAG: hypothetical protein JWN44_1464 [Myxococcales bacterium]|nr:hypothetical protein [Myxococcales bacterium]